jgi:uncharacterized membrane protein YphA (DoxX/SURF4 family)
MFERKIVGMAPGPRLGALRVLIVLAALYVVLTENFIAFSEIPSGWYSIRGLMKIVPVMWIQQWMSAPVNLLILKAALLVFLTSSLIGLFARFSLFVSSLLYFVFLGILNGYVEVPSLHVVTLYLLFSLVWLPSGDALSVDASLKKKDKFRFEQRLSPEAGWSVFLLRTVLALSFFQSGFAKLHNSGLLWIEPWNLKRIVIENRFAHLDFNLAWMDYFLSWPDEVWKILAAAVLLMELFFPVVLFSWRLRRVYPVVYLVLQLVLMVLSGRFLAHPVLLLFIFFDIDRMLQLTPLAPQDRRQGFLSLWPRRS